MWDDDDDDAQPSSMRQCIDCRLVAPKTDTNYTLISSKFGWRLSRRTDANGGLIVEWRCPACWEKHKAAKSPASGSTPPSSARRPEIGQPPSSRRPDLPPSSRRPVDTPPPPPPARRFGPDSGDSKPPSSPPPTRRLR